MLKIIIGIQTNFWSRSYHLIIMSDHHLFQLRAEPVAPSNLNCYQISTFLIFISADFRSRAAAILDIQMLLFRAGLFERLMLAISWAAILQKPRLLTMYILKFVILKLAVIKLAILKLAI